MEIKCISRRRKTCASLSVLKGQRIRLEEAVALHRWMYRGGRPNTLAKILNRGSAILHSLGIFPNYFVTLEVVGRKSGKLISFPLAACRRELMKWGKSVTIGSALSTIGAQ